jgi:hypothetical protein
MNPQACTKHFSSLRHYIVRSAHRASRYITGSDIITDDLARDVRFHLARALEAGRVEEPAVRRLVTNALRDRIRFERSRIQLTSSNIWGTG